MLKHHPTNNTFETAVCVCVSVCVCVCVCVCVRVCVFISSHWSTFGPLQQLKSTDHKETQHVMHLACLRTR